MEGGRVIVSLTLDMNELLKLYISKSAFKRCSLGQPFPNVLDFGHLKGKSFIGGFEDLGHGMPLHY